MNARTLVVAMLLTAVPVWAGDTRPFVRGSWQQLRNAHEGQAVVVHFWGVTCAPCLADLPKWGQLRRARPSARIVMVAADPVPMETPQIAAAVSRARIDAGENWMFADSFIERLYYEVNPAWTGELPYTVLIGADGRASFVSGVTDVGTIRTWLDAQPVRRGHSPRPSLKAR